MKTFITVLMNNKYNYRNQKQSDDFINIMVNFKLI